MPDYPNVPIGPAIGDLHTGYIPNLTDPSEAKRYREAVHILANPAFPAPTRQVDGSGSTYSYITYKGLNSAYGYDLGGVTENSTEDYLGTGSIMKATLKEVWLNCVLSASGSPEAFSDTSQGCVSTQLHATAGSHVLANVYTRWDYTDLMQSYDTLTAHLFSETRGILDYYTNSELRIDNTSLRIKYVAKKLNHFFYQVNVYNPSGPIYNTNTECNDLRRSSLLYFETRLLTKYPVTGANALTPTDTADCALLSSFYLLGVSSGSAKPIDKVTESEIIRGYPGVNIPMRYPTYAGGIGFKIRTNQKLRGYGTYTIDSIYTMSSGGYEKHVPFLMAMPRRLGVGRNGTVVDWGEWDYWWPRTKTYAAGLSLHGTSNTYASELGSQFSKGFYLYCMKFKNLKVKIGAIESIYTYNGYPNYDYSCINQACVQYIDTVARTNLWGIETFGKIYVMARGFRVGNAFKVVLSFSKLVKTYVGDYCSTVYGSESDYRVTWSTSYQCSNYAATTLVGTVDELVNNTGTQVSQIIESSTLTKTSENVILTVDVGTTQTVTRTLFGTVEVEVIITIDSSGLYTAFTVRATAASPSTSEYAYSSGVVTG